jgi:hypothetical protein
MALSSGASRPSIADAALNIKLQWVLATAGIEAIFGITPAFIRRR